jgi:hypothetical protein
MRAHKHSKLSRDGKRQHEVDARQQLLKLLLQPNFCSAPLADWAMPVPARFQNVMEFLALLAAIDDTARIWRPTTHDGYYRLDLIGVHLVSELFQVGWPVGTEDLTDRRGAGCNDLIVVQGFLFMIKLIIVMAASSPTVVMWR